MQTRFRTRERRVLYRWQPDLYRELMHKVNRARQSRYQVTRRRIRPWKWRAEN